MATPKKKMPVEMFKSKAAMAKHEKGESKKMAASEKKSMQKEMVSKKSKIKVLK